MFKTEEQIDEMAKGFEEGSAEHGYHRAESYRGFRLGYIKAQQDILKSMSRGKEEAWINYRKGEGHSFGHKEALDYGWQACALFHKAQIDTLKQRELEYQSDLRQKDAEIERLNKALEEAKHINSSEALLNTSLSRKYQEAVKDIEWLAPLREYDTYTELDKLYAIQARYGLNKREG